MNERLDRIMDRGHLEALRDALQLVTEVATDRRMFTREQIDVVREIKSLAERIIWGSVKGGDER